MKKNFGKALKNNTLSLAGLVITLLIILGGGYFYVVLNLPDVQQLREVSLQIPLRIYTRDQQLIGEFGEKKRIPVKLAEVPPKLIEAILDTEDQRFFDHQGVDIWGLLRAGIIFVTTGKKLQGASTITMQVARNFFLNREKTFGRKLNEILLALSIDRTFSKKQILELYLNKIYFGSRAYGVAAAAQVYYGKKLSELTLAEMAMLAGLPRAPSKLNPIINPRAAAARRAHVLRRMLDSKHLTEEEYKKALVAPVITYHHEVPVTVYAPHVAEWVRNELMSRYGSAVYELGLVVYTSLDSHLQKAATAALTKGILEYESRHEYRGPEITLDSLPEEQWLSKLRNLSVVANLLPAVIFEVTENYITVLTAENRVVTLNDAASRTFYNRLKRGDVVRIYSVNGGNSWRLGQLPEVEGALVALDAKTGAILALSGVFSYEKSNFNRITQAERQTGSAFKPFVYAAALDHGYTLASVINDAPIVLFDQSSQSYWRPQNNSHNFYGPTSLRTAMIYSRNLASIRLLQSVGIPYTVNYLRKFGFSGRRELPPALSLALGTGTMTPLKLAGGYAVFANGGYRVQPWIIERIMQCRQGSTKMKELWYVQPQIVSDATDFKGKRAPQVLKATTAYLINNMLQDVIRRGTAAKAQILKRHDLAGKTGSTNDLVDAWFVGYNPQLVAAVWLGYDQPKSLEEHGAKAALPIWIDFMREALSTAPEQPFIRPEEIIEVKIDPETGLLAASGAQTTRFELFEAGTEPQESASSEDGGNNSGEAVISDIW